MYFTEPEVHQSIEFQPYASSPPPPDSSSPSTCSQDHRSSLVIQTLEGGSICLVCFSNLISNPRSPTVHVSYALSQLSLAISQPPFRSHLLRFHPHFLVSPLVESLSCFDDEPIARQIIDLVSDLCSSAGDSVCGEFVARISGRLSSGALAWSRRQVYTLHCLGILLGYQKSNPYSHISEKDDLISNLVMGLQLPSEEIQGEILFVLYKMSILQYTHKDDDGSDALYSHGPKLLLLSLEALMKNQRDDVRLNCVAFLTVLAHRGFFENACSNDIYNNISCEGDSFMQRTEHLMDGSSLNILFAEAIKAPLLSSDCELQVSTLDLIFLYLSRQGDIGKDIRVLVDENIADYVFEMLRLCGCKDPAVTSCVQVLDLLSTAEEAFRQRLACGFSTLVPVLRYVSEIPFHPVQAQTLKLILGCVSNCPGIVSSSHIEELGLTLTGVLKKYNDGDIGMLTETFSLVCSVLVATMKSPSSYDNSNFIISVQNASRHAILSCLNQHEKHPSQLMHSLYLLKEAYAYSLEGCSTSSPNSELRNCILSICKTDLLPWFLAAFNEMEEEDIVLGVLETFHSILLQDPDTQGREFAKSLLSSSWFTFSFGCLGLFPTEKMRWRVYLMLSSIIDVLLGSDSGQPIRDAALNLPSDPIDLLFLLGQTCFNNVELISCHSAILLILYTSSLHEDRLADDKLVLASLEQYILVNSSENLDRSNDSVPAELLVNLYGLYRGRAKMSYQISYSTEAERILFNLLTEREWNFPSARIHATSLKWLFQQERICKPLCSLMLKLCRCNNSYGNHVILQGASCQNIDVDTIAELIALEDNLAAKVLVYVLKELADTHQEDDVISVLGFISVIINIFPAASDQLCLHDVGSAIQSLYCHTGYLSPGMSMLICQLIFGILHSVQPESLSDEESWLEITMKLMDYLVAGAAVDRWTEESFTVMGILCLILNHSTNNALLETSKTILLSTPLSSVIKNIIHVACAKGPALFDHDEGTKIGETLLVVLSLQFFSLQRLMHFGSPLVKIVASCCLLELFTRILDQKTEQPDKLNCEANCMWSIMAVLEGLIFCSDSNVAINSSLCLSMIIEWEKLDGELLFTRRSNWCRLIVEELAISLAVPCLASESFMFYHKPAIHVAVQLLKLQKVPKWMDSVFEDSCIAGIVNNLSSSNLSIEILLLFRALMNAGFLKSDHIAGLNRVFQACRKRLYSSDTQDSKGTEHKAKEFGVPDDLGKIFQHLMKIILSQTSLGFRGDRLLEELELFSRSLMEEDDS